jgi:tungstate transport system permease protein
MGSMEFLYEGFIKALKLIISLDPYVLSVTKVQLAVSGTAVVLGTLTAIPLAILLAFTKFPGKAMSQGLITTAMGLPPVGVGLFVFLLITRRGPLGFLDLLYTPSAMILAQYILATPIILGVSLSALEEVPQKIKDMAFSLGGRYSDVIWIVVKEAKLGILTGILAGFGRAIAEVGAILTVGGNIVHIIGSQEVSYTRTLTTAITVEARQGNIPEAIAFGIILISLAFIVNVVLVNYVMRFSKGYENV